LSGEMSGEWRESGGGEDSREKERVEKVGKERGRVERGGEDRARVRM